MVNKKIYLLLSTFFCIFISIAACGPPATTSDQGIPETEDADVLEKLQSNHNLDTRLNMLVTAYKAGEAEEVARKNNIELIDGGVRVGIDCKKGQEESVTEKVRALGIIEIVNSIGIQAVVPISNLEAVAPIPGVRLVSIPTPAQPQD